MGMVLGHHIAGRLGPAPAVDSCSFTLKSDDPTPEPFSASGGSRRDVRFRPDGLRAWTHWTLITGGFDTHQYDLPAPWQLTGWTPAGNLLRNGGLNRSMDWHNNGTQLTFTSRWFSSFRRIDDFDMSATPYDVSSGLGAGIGAVTALVGGEYIGRWSLDGFSLFVNSFASELRRYRMAVAHDLSTNLGFDQFWDYGATGFTGFTDTMEFSTDHTRIYMMHGSGGVPSQRLLSFDLTGVDDISAPFNPVTGVSTNLPTNLQVGRGMNIRPDTGDIILLADQNNQRIRCWSGGVAPTTDADFNDVVLLLDFDGPDGGTNITDLSNSGHTETFFGNAQIDTAVFALGQSTMLLDGAGDFLTFPDSIDWDFGTGDFTIEFNIDLDVLTSQTFMGNYLTGSGADKGISIELQGGAPDLRVLRGDDVLATVVWAGAAINTDFHIAVSRSGTDLRIFVDGAELVSVTDSSDFTGSVQPWRIGSLDGAAQFLDGNIGAVRVTKGTGRYTAPFTAPVCFYPSVPVPASPIIASGAPSITKPTATGIAVLQQNLAMEAGTTIIGSGASSITIPASGSEAADDRIFVYGSNEVPLVDGTWEQLNTAPTSFFVFTKVAAGDATDLAQTQGSSVGHAVFIKFTMKDIAGTGSWDFNAQSTLRNTGRTAFDCNGLPVFGGVAPSCSFFVGLRIGSGPQPGSVGDFSSAPWNTPPDGGTILKVTTGDANTPFNTYWSAISFLCEPTKVVYPTGLFWSGANAPNSHTTQTRGWRYDHD